MHNEFHFSHRNVVSSQHAKVRSQQRCIPDAIRDLLIDFGKTTPAGSSSERFTFDKKSWRSVQRYLGAQAKHFEKYRNVYVILSSDGTVVTEGWMY